ncbi:cytochrome P450 [Apodospora peruviana]|uniref:Cytochrome P450 n=1 Tax=Apodospora peruviana TaxID=516989 RepID=A0AAE0HZY1_9PEZI|nr:cytochrome P450 [Apodospora peruviana]
MFTLTEATLVASGILAILYLGYRAVLPKPIPGIPYNHDATSKLLGDMPEMLGYVMRTKRMFCWLTSLTNRHQSPIVQAFIKPMSNPWVVVTDPFESQDILLRRTKEFDRASFFSDVLSGIIPMQHTQYRSDHAVFKDHRNLINHLMAPTFLNQISGPEVYNSVCTLVKLWQVKCDKAQGRPFEAHHDITYSALDGIFAALFQVGESDSITLQRLNTTSVYNPDLPNDIDTPVSFPDGKIPQIFEAMLTLTNSVMVTQLFPFPHLASLVHKRFPSMRRAIATKETFVRNKIDEAVHRIEQLNDRNPRTAIHSVLLREKELAAKKSRPPAYHQRGIYDEFVGLVMAGHDTSATTIAWGVKFLAFNPAPQTRLREELHAAIPAAVTEKRAPTYTELTQSHIPYLDAVVEEVLRLSNSIDFVVRVSLCDTTVLGHPIPKGTDVFLMANGAGFIEPNMASVSDEMRSPGARKASGRMLTGLWDDEGIGAFRPERWVTTDKETGKETFDSLAGPTLAFGLGPRGCYGRRLALMSLRMQFAMIVWHFELLQTPEGLSSFEGVQKFAREPQQCFVRLKRAVC